MCFLRRWKKIRLNTIDVLQVTPMSRNSMVQFSYCNSRPIALCSSYIGRSLAVGFLSSKFFSIKNLYLLFFMTTRFVQSLQLPPSPLPKRKAMVRAYSSRTWQTGYYWIDIVICISYIVFNEYNKLHYKMESR